MATPTLDFEAARADLRGKVATNEAALTQTRDRLGALALDVTLGNAAQSELDAANAECARLQSNAGALEGALAEVDRREAAHNAAEAERQRKADERRLDELAKVRHAAGQKLAKLVEDLVSVCSEGVAAENEALKLGRKLGVNTASNWGAEAWTVLAGRLYGVLPGAPYVHPTKTNEVAERLRAV